ncbi:TPA: hypothetical protein RRM88_001760 [Staphylococcus argenteus]|uniref:hypothetical protein n=1 Tax=Staphylococcus argenteus TaxID=985002 RepID=UPI00050780AA|nr:hypothetical protein [Staphylococcus argenteus]MBE2136530.1 hypothetical protein [Staphylococcus argenteus]MDT3005868.1 hypothetical protein [Staphylococcus argenteus]UPO20730.1 hypothetical protein M0D62_12835 [Staphylococcus argenteus]CDR64250.1 hypothetical protein ERS154949_01602 [Staphylococcus argenteus]HDY9446351.1 hypothetical protein [Staphylococcus argenteus]
MSETDEPMGFEYTHIHIPLMYQNGSKYVLSIGDTKLKLKSKQIMKVIAHSVQQIVYQTKYKNYITQFDDGLNRSHKFGFKQSNNMLFIFAQFNKMSSDKVSFYTQHRHPFISTNFPNTTSTSLLSSN